MVLPLPLSPTTAVIGRAPRRRARARSRRSATVCRRSRSPPPKVLVTWRASSSGRPCRRPHAQSGSAAQTSGPHLAERGRLAPAARPSRAGSAGGTRSPAASRSSDGGSPGMPWNAPFRSSDGRLAISSRRVRVQRLRRRSSRTAQTRPAPAYITPRRSTNWAISPMSWPTRMTAAPSSPGPGRSVSITWRWTTTSSALVGSSAMMTFGAQADRDGDADALLHAAAELVREHVGDLAAGRPAASRSREPVAELRLRQLARRGRAARRRSGRGRAGPG